MGRDHRGKSSRLRWALSGGAYLLILAILFAGTLGWFARQGRGREAEMEERFSRRVEMGALFIGSYLDDVAARERRYALASGFSGDTSAREFKRFVETMDFSAALLLDHSGRLITQYPKGDAAPGDEVASGYPHLSTAVLERKVAVSPVVFSLAEKEPIAAVAVPFTAAGGRRFVVSGGIYVERTPLAEYLAGVAAINGTAARISDTNGNIVAETGSKGDLGASENFMSASAVPGAPWRLTASVSKASLYGVGDRDQTTALGAAALVSLAGALVMHLLARLRKGKRALVTMAFQDPLTGLATRRLADDRIEHAVARADRTETGVALALVDLDDFKSVNDQLGHHAGDELLVAVARRLAGSIREYDTAARFGGDEFLIVMDGCVSSEIAEDIARRAQNIFSEPFEVNGQMIAACGSVGVAFSGGDVESEELLRRADVALYAAKEEGKGRCALYHPGIEERRADGPTVLAGATLEPAFASVFQPLGPSTGGTLKVLTRNCSASPTTESLAF